MPGIDRDRFIGSQFQTFLCPVCKDVADDPVSTSNCGCDQIFCKSCITQVFQHTGNCPHCSCDTGKQTKPLQRQLKELYLKLRLKCSQANCKVKLNVSAFMNHDNSCPEIPWNCGECGLEGNVTQRDDHHCMSWLITERSRLLKELEEANVKIASLESALTSNFEDRGNLQGRLAELESILDQVTEESSGKINMLESELDKYKERLAEAESLREELVREMSDNNSTAATRSTSPAMSTTARDQIRQFARTDAHHNGGDKNSNHAKSTATTLGQTRSTARDVLDSEYRRMSISDTNQYQTRVMGAIASDHRQGATGGYGSASNGYGNGMEYSSLQSRPESNGRSSQRKEVVFLRDTKAGQELKEQVSGALRTADSRRLHGMEFCKDVRDTMQSIHGGIWHCFIAERYIPKRVKYIESTFCSVKFDGRDYYIFRDQKMGGNNFVMSLM